MRRTLARLAITAVSLGAAVAHAEDAPAVASEASTTPIGGERGTAHGSDVRPPETGDATQARGSAASVSPLAAREPDDTVRWLVARARYDAVIGWASRYQLSSSLDGLGLEQLLWRRVDVLPFYHRLAVDGTLRLDRGVALSLHFSGWVTPNLLADPAGGVAAGAVVLGFLELDVAPPGSEAPVSLWLGRRFITHGPPGGIQLDGGGGRIGSRMGVFAELFVGRPVTPTRSSLLGPEPSFDGASVAYGARVGYDDPGVFVASAAYAELWGHGMLGSRTVDVTSLWDPGPLSIEGSLKLDVASPAVVLARLAAIVPIARELSIDLEGQHLEPARWIPPWSILSAFEASTFDEIAGGATVRLAPGLAARAQGAARIYVGEVPGEVRVGYRAEALLRLVPVRDEGSTTFRVLASRRDDGVLGYTLVTAGLSTAPVPVLRLAIDGALAIDDAAERVSVSGRASFDASPGAEWTVGAWASIARTPTSDADARAMIRARWEPVL